MPYLCILSDTSILQYFSTQQKWHVLSLNCQTSSSSLWYCTAQLPLCLQGQSHHFFQKCFTIPWNGSVVHSQSFRLPRVAQVLQPPIRPHSGGREVLQGPPLRGPWCFVLFFFTFLHQEVWAASKDTKAEEPLRRKEKCQGKFYQTKSIRNL